VATRRTDIAARTALLSVVGPVALMIAGPLLLDEVPTLLQWIGTAVTLAALGWYWLRR
jgi:drug/metabolite transporter (DMT)-like permease